MYLHKPSTMHPVLRRYVDLYIRWHSRVAEHIAMQRHPAWWC